MTSPFPGMNPYLEAYWSNVHVLMIVALTAQLKRVLPAGLAARPEEQVLLETLEYEPRPTYRPDVSVVELPAPESPPRALAGGVVVAEPVRVRSLVRERKIRWIEIVDERDRGRVVTVVELLSPSNKAPGDDRRRYHRKVRHYFRAGVSLVEIDLLRGERRRMWFTWERLGPSRQKDYLVLVRRRKSPVIEAYPIGLRERLPAVAVPLRATDADVPLDLQAALLRVFEDGPFDSIDYSRPPDPPLDPPDAEWAAELVAARRGA